MIHLRPLVVRCAIAIALAPLACLAVADDAAAPPKKLRVGIIGLDTSHVIAFTQAIRDPKSAPELQNLQVVAAYKGGSQEVAASRDRIDGFTEQIKKLDVELVDSIDALLERVDVVLLESVDSRQHLEQIRPVLKAKKPVFIDKPVAGNVADAIEIFRLAEEAGVPVFSSSALRFGPAVDAARDEAKLGKVLGCTVHSPCTLEPHHPDLFWYGVHGMELMYTLMGGGCKTVQRTTTADIDVATGVWKDGRVATFRGIRKGKSDYGGLVYGEKGIEPIGKFVGYNPLLVEIAKFFQSGKPPVSAAETIEMFAFMEAADESKRQGGKPVLIEDVMKKAREQIATRGK